LFDKLKKLINPYKNPKNISPFKKRLNAFN
jgi:hypothetical protein